MSREASHESQIILDILDWTHPGDGRDLVEVCFNAEIGNDLPQELASGVSECAFL
jgi:hypothetical protein